MKKAVFLDRDGVINHTIFRKGKPRAPYHMGEFAFIDGVKEAVKLLKERHFLLIIVTNQPDVSRGWVSREEVDIVNKHVKEVLGVHQIRSCFHDNQDNCLCRKPRPGMLIDASKEWNIDLKNSFMAGDRISDVQAGQEAGCRTILVGAEDSSQLIVKPEFQCEDLLSAAKWIIRR